MVIREATVEDVPRVHEMAVEFAKAGAYVATLPFASDKLRTLAETLIREPWGGVLVAEVPRVPRSFMPGGSFLVGMIALTALPHPMAHTHVCEEVAWWVDAEYRAAGGGCISRQREHAGLALLGAAEVWARSKGCSMIKIVAPDRGRVGLARLYRRLRYEPVESAFMKGLLDDGDLRRID